MIPSELNTGCAHLGIGPISQNCVDAAMALAYECHHPLIFVASRRQVEGSQLGFGYVNDWSTVEFSAYVSEYNPEGLVVLGRDHGGPWQHDQEANLDLPAAMVSAKESYARDIDAGFRLLHIDPIFGLGNGDPVSIYAERTLELYTFCHEYALKKKRPVGFEVGTEIDPVGSLESSEVARLFRTVLLGCKKQRLPTPTFMVCPLGTKVMESRNVGQVEKHLNGEFCPRLAEALSLIDLCHKNGVLVKVHNGDFLSQRALSWFVQQGVDAINIAPEFGILETRAFLSFLRRLKLWRLEEQFLELAYQSRKWLKWMLPDSQATMRERAIIAGHYVFATPEFKILQIKAAEAGRRQGLDLYQVLQDAVRTGLLRCMKAVGYSPRKKPSPQNREVNAMSLAT